MQAEEYRDALLVKAKEGDVDAIINWLSSLERDPNSQALLLGPDDGTKISKVLCSACASSRPGCVRVARLILESLTVVSVDCCKFPGEEVALRARFCRQGGRGGP